MMQTRELRMLIAATTPFAPDMVGRPSQNPKLLLLLLLLLLRRRQERVAVAGQSTRSASGRTNCT